jgi:imidazoleglycerol-phosphate dehydratase
MAVEHPQRRAQIERTTLETRIRVTLDLDGRGRARFQTGVPFLDHILDQVPAMV